VVVRWRVVYASGIDCRALENQKPEGGVDPGGLFMRRHLGAVFFGVVLALWGCGQVLAQGNWVATPGVGVGPVKLGMSVTDIEKVLTRSPRDDHQIVSGKPKWIYYAQGLQVHYDENVRALQVVVEKSGIQTPEGLQVGDPSAKIQAVYGAPTGSHQLPTAANRPKQYYYVYSPKGVGFQTEGDRILLVYIFEKK
jgi:hypothetical protein